MGFADMIPTDAPSRVRTKVLADWLEISESTVLAWARRGTLPKPRRLGPRILVFETAKVRLYLQCLDDTQDNSG